MVITLFGRPARRRPNRTGSRTAPPAFLNDSQWFLIADLFPQPPITGRGGRPRVPPRACLEGVLWVLTDGRSMERFTRAISQSYNLLATTEGLDAGPASVQRVAEIAGAVWTALKQINWDEAMGDGTFSPGKKGARRSATPRKARAPRSC